ncbi:hypothetical protein PMAYCL1PPCAC_24969, partial [Pristionchus mayeri]
ETLFFGDFTEKGKDEVEIKDGIYEEFVYLLHVIYPGLEKIMHRNVEHILKLADRFQIEHLMKQSEEHLMKSDRFDIVNKLLLADQYRLDALKVKCFDTLKYHKCERQKLKSFPEFFNFSDDIKTAIKSVIG